MLIMFRAAMFISANAAATGDTAPSVLTLLFPRVHMIRIRMRGASRRAYRDKDRRTSPLGLGPILRTFFDRQ
mgnify:CR=1|tara:strand:- start:454 stop:669 length:216 start_codon:yes stop_codon:yes gene_type:complete